ncbi:ALP1-like protein [Tanacetum coccineum]
MGSNNDVNVLRQSPVLNDLKVGKAPEVPFVANDVTYKWGYYLTDGIYPEWAVLMKSISQPGSNDVKRIRYKQAHEAARKDVERAFGVLKKKWAIVRTPARSRSLKRITHLMYTCIILHNMIRKEKGKAISPDFYPEEQHREDDPMKEFSRRGVLLDFHLCPLCNAAMEDVQHVFFRCDVARVVLRKICRWWDLDWQEICSFSDWDAWFLSFRLSSRLKSILEGVFYVAWWRIWRLRNQLVFDASPPNRSTIFDDIVIVMDIVMTNATTKTTAPEVAAPRIRRRRLSSSAAQTHPVTGEPIHRTIPLILARLARHDDMIEQLYDQFQDMSLDRMGMIEYDMETLHSRVDVAELRVEILQLALADAREEIMELRTRVSTLEQRAQGPQTMSTMGQGMSSVEIEQIIAQRVTNAIAAIAICETKTREAHDSMDQVARQGAK